MYVGALVQPSLTSFVTSTPLCLKHAESLGLRTCLVRLAASQDAQRFADLNLMCSLAGLHLEF